MIAHSTSESSEAYIALGANLGDREQTLFEALSLLDEHPHISVLRCSALYETEPVGYVDQPAFLNMAVAVQVMLTPEQLLTELLDIENRLGRVRDIRWGPRTVDLDLLWMHGETRDTELLQLPHPRMGERAFVLVPLSDIVPEGEISGLYTFVHSSLSVLDGKDGIQLWKTCNWPTESGHSGS
ncbi:2-amino-4-hydroxy-6-hydroxymethyldihydropteridine diphosphokinase [Paenibacillus sp. FSL H7-0942]|uniref:2-amino-4-hydroxy-6- hydroxymethyldihydropteridine diphosphokinase n=1 Tax=Paenibacillus TaxID=44249 RepID=UPI000FDBB218|nr:MULTISPECIES: 2-amino-4-hydroxy-6-hydroxymethyldihydropteridine diphosphokinase [Paenibacillus]MCP1424023.1 2-amino-4-hydroxy-6-hydroxymethyldihydropteridine diphosphokinase [Paenibacillus xylanexedens]WFA84050.1 2-amino-4-hydroxy-6-hydroxymethyldihydropteridine diphosphokinase [Paenibacillus amylolyticus]